jgi:16S rRNA processing protein RimM
MSNEAEPELIVVGQLAGVFGVKGWLKVRSFTQPEDNLLAYLPWRVKTAQGVKMVEVDAFKQRPQGIVVHFKGLDDRDVAASYGRAEILVERKLLPPLSEGDFYWHQLVGLKVVSEYAGREVLLGVVEELMATGANDVLVVNPCGGSIDDRDRLVPYVIDLYVRRVDLALGEIRVDWDPEF